MELQFFCLLKYYIEYVIDMFFWRVLMVVLGINVWVLIFFFKDFIVKMCQVYVFYYVGYICVGYFVFGVDFICICECVIIILYV